MSELKVKLPDANTPGFLRRLAEAEKYREDLDANNANIGKLIEFLLVFVIEPKDKDEAIGLLMDLSFVQYKQLLNVITTPPENPT